MLVATTGERGACKAGKGVPALSSAWWKGQHFVVLWLSWLPGCQCLLAAPRELSFMGRAFISAVLEYSLLSGVFLVGAGSSLAEGC